MIPNFHYDQELVDEVAQNFDLREPNRQALMALVERLSGGYDPQVPQVMDMATGAGKTYLMAAFIEYLRRQDILNVMIVTPGLVVQNKTIGNFTQGHSKFITGAEVPPRVITPENYISQLSGSQIGIDYGGSPHSDVYVFNIQQLIAPKTMDGDTSSGADGTRRGIRKYNEFVGVLYDDLASLDDLVVIADEHHLYGPQAKAFYKALKDLHPAATVGLTASAEPRDEVVYRYPLHQAISDGHVKVPVIAYRKGGYGELGEHQQLRDAVALLYGKTAAYEAHVKANPGTKNVTPLLFVVCSDIDHASQVTAKLRTTEFFGTDDAVLQVDSDHMNSGTENALENLDSPGSPVRAVVSVNKLKEGWDVKSIAVMVTLRTMGSETLTQQTMGRGLRLPFGKWVSDPNVNELDIVAHESFRKLLEAENVLKSFGLSEATSTPEEIDEVVAPTHDWGPRDVLSPDGVESPSADLTDLPSPRPRALTEDDADTAADTEVRIGGTGGVRARQIVADDDEDAAIPPEPEVVQVSVQPRFAGTTFLFPRTVLVREDHPFELTEITDDQIEDAARLITTQTDRMEREALIADDVERRIRTRTRRQAEVESVMADPDAVASELLAEIFARNSIVQSSENIADARHRVVPLLMEAAPVEPGSWTVKAAASAVSQMVTLVDESTKKFNAQLAVQVKFNPLRLPVDTSYFLPVGQSLVDRNLVASASEFAARQHYSEWNSGLFDAASFDSYSGEFALAALMDKSPNIVWWKRLYRSDDAYISYTLRDRYFPDFAAMDTDGRIWIIEGKDRRGRKDEIVQAKRSAAVRAIRLMNTREPFQGQLYGYLIGYEDVIAASDSWAELCDRSEVAITRRYGA